MRAAFLRHALHQRLTVCEKNKGLTQTHNVNTANTIKLVLCCSGAPSASQQISLKSHYVTKRLLERSIYEMDEVKFKYSFGYTSPIENICPIALP